MPARLLLAALCVAAGACGAVADDAAPTGKAAGDEAPGDPAPPAGTAPDAGAVATVDPRPGTVSDAGADRAPVRGDAPAGVTGDAGAPDASPPVASDPAFVLAWDGESKPVGSCWGKPLNGGTARCSLSAAQASRSGKAPNHAWLFDVHTSGGTESGWNWAHGVSIANARYVVFWVRVVGDVPPRDFVVSLRDAATGTYSIDHKGFLGGSIRKFSPGFADGNWNQVRMPLGDVFGALPRFAAVQELCIRGTTANASFQIFVDEIGFSP